MHCNTISYYKITGIGDIGYYSYYDNPNGQ
jgi:hypothetical protein